MLGLLKCVFYLISILKCVTDLDFWVVLEGGKLLQLKTNIRLLTFTGYVFS